MNQSSEHDANDRPQVFQRILVALDDSQQAAWAAGLAAKLASCFGAELFAAHIYPQPLWVPELQIPLRQLEDSARATGEAVLEQQCSRLPPNLHCQRLLREGDPAEEIATLAENLRPDLIVIGTHGRGRIRRFILGSTAGSVIRKVQCPVLTVSHPPDGSDTPARKSKAATAATPRIS